MSLSTKESSHTLCTYTSMYKTKDKACTFIVLLRIKPNLLNSA